MVLMLKINEMIDLSFWKLKEIFIKFKFLNLYKYLFSFLV